MSGTTLRRPEQLREVLGVPFSQSQLLAATSPLEPAVVVAGAGSGKTTVMAARVVWLVGSGQVQPEQVLGLTFTNKAAGELAARVRAALRQLGGPGADDDDLPTVSTYHAYAGRLVQEHGLRLGVEPSARLLADATRFQLAERVLRQARGPFTSLDKTLPSLVDDLLSLDGELAEHLVSPDELRAFDDALIAELADLADLDKPTKDVLLVASSARKRRELLGLVEAYREQKRLRDLVDFGDQTALAARLAQECPDVGAVERERFRVVLLDEYQDTSVAQRRTLVGLFGGGHPVTAVGDPCQAIYGWRGASVANLDDFPQHFERSDGRPAPRYALVENRRSGGWLLALANVLASALHVRHGVDPLVACAEKADSGHTECALFETYDEEISWVADRVRAEIGDGTAPGEIAVLVRARSDFAALHEALTSRDIPVEVVGLGGLLALPEVADVVAVLEVLIDPTANAALLRLLSGPRWRIGSRDLALLGRRARAMVSTDADAHTSLPGGDVDGALELAVGGTDPADVVSLLEAVEHIAREGRAAGAGIGISDEARVRFAAIARELAHLRRGLTDPLLDVIQRVVATTGLDVELATQAGEHRSRGDGLSAFLDVAASFSDLDGNASPRSFLAFLRAADDYERGLETAAPTTGDSVKLLTAHKAKGLEWDVVVVPDLTRGVFPSIRAAPRWTSNGHVLPTALRGDAEDLPDVTEWTGAGLKSYVSSEKTRAELEERRLGYVAVTRARRSLVATGHWWGPTQKKPRGPSDYLLTIREHCTAGPPGAGTVVAWAADPQAGATSPVLARAPGEWAFPAPLEPVALRGRRVIAARVHELLQAEHEIGADAAVTARTDRPGAPEVSGPPQPAGAPDVALTAQEQEVARAWERDATVLLEELRRDRRRHLDVEVPTSLSASQLMRLAADPDGLARELARPLPRRPAPAARRGTEFHAWVESRFGAQPLLDPQDLPGAADEAMGDADLAELQAAFLRTSYASLAPHILEAPFELYLGGRIIRGRIDAVYRDALGRYEVVDWKTGNEHADPLQLAIYQLAWAELAGVNPADVTASFVYVRSGLVVRPGALPDRLELGRLLTDPGRSRRLADPAIDLTPMSSATTAARPNTSAASPSPSGSS